MTTDGFTDVWAEDSKEYKPGDQAWYTHFRIGRVAPERYEGSRFPEGDEAQDQFFRQMTPNTGNYDQAVDAAALGAVQFAESYNADGGDCTVVDLPKEGITDNSHFMFQEMNNAEIAEHIENWLEERGLS